GGAETALAIALARLGFRRTNERPAVMKFEAAIGGTAPAERPTEADEPPSTRRRPMPDGPRLAAPSFSRRAGAAGAAPLGGGPPRAEQASHDGVEDRRENETEKSDAEHAGKHRRAQRLPHLGAGAAGDHQRHDAEDEGEGRHQDRPQPRARRLRRRLARRRA